MKIRGVSMSDLARHLDMLKGIRLASERAMTRSLAITPQITCPRCEKTFEPDIWVGIDVKERPDLLERVRNYTLHQLTCTHCGYEFGVDAPLLVYRPGEEPPVFISPAEETEGGEDIEAARLLITHLQRQLGSEWNDDWIRDGIPMVVRSMLTFVVRDPDAPHMRLARQLLQELTDSDLDLLSALDAKAQEELEAANSELLGKLATGRATDPADTQAQAHVIAGMELMESKDLDPDEALEGAIAHFENALALLPVDEAEARAQVMTFLGNAYMERVVGDPVENGEAAIAYYEDASNTMARAGNLKESARVAALLAVAYDNRLAGHSTENIAHILVHTDWALEMLEPGEDPELWAITKTMRGKAFRDRSQSQGLGRMDYDIALIYFNDALTVLNEREYPEYWAQMHYEIGLTHSFMLPGDDPDKIAKTALKHFRQALRVFSRRTAPEIWAQTHMRLGYLYTDWARARGGDHRLTRDAVSHFEDAMSVYTYEDAPEHWARARFAVGRAYAHDDRQRTHEQTIGHFDAALSVFDRETHAEERLEVLSELANLLIARRQWAQATSLLEEATGISTELLEESYSMVARRTTVAATAGLSNLLAFCLYQSDNLDSALIELEAGKSRLLADTLLLDELDMMPLSDEHRQVFTWLRQEIGKLEATAYGGLGDIADVDRLIAARADLRRLLDTIRVEYPDLLPRQLTVTQMTPSSPGTALVIPLITHLGSAVFILPYGATTLTPENVIPLPNFTTETINQLLVSGNRERDGWLVTYRMRSEDPQGSERWRTVIDQVVRLLWEPFMEPIVGRLRALDVHQIIFLPQGGLQFLPLHAVCYPVEGQPHYLLDDFIVTYAPSAYVLDVAGRRQQSRPSAGRAMIAGVSAYESLPPLPFVSEEVESIARFFNAAPLLDKQATKQAIIKAVPDATVVHIACHGAGWALDPSSKFSFSRPIILHLGSDGLTFEDILTELDLHQTRLVTLSACDTGLVDVGTPWDEFAGLPNAFLQAGAGATVSSLWAVDDRSTALLMERFYRNVIDQEMALGAALQEAQIWLRSSTRQALGAHYETRVQAGVPSALDAYSELMLGGAPDDTPYSHPYYWAAFFLTGL